MENLRAAVFAFVVGCLLILSAQAKAQTFEYKEIYIEEIDNVAFDVVYFVESDKGWHNDPDVGQNACSQYLPNGKEVRYHCSNEVYLYAAGVFGDPSKIEAIHIVDGHTVTTPAYVIRQYSDGCRHELDEPAPVDHGTYYVNVYCKPGTPRAVLDSHKAITARKTVKAHS